MELDLDVHVLWDDDLGLHPGWEPDGAELDMGLDLELDVYRRKHRLREHRRPRRRSSFGCGARTSAKPGLCGTGRRERSIGELERDRGGNTSPAAGVADGCDRRAVDLSALGSRFDAAGACAAGDAAP
jgi:hypothetical protein